MREGLVVVCSLGNGLTLGWQGAGGRDRRLLQKNTNNDDDALYHRNETGTETFTYREQLARAVRIRPQRRALSCSASAATR